MNMQVKFSLPAMSNKSKDQFSPPLLKYTIPSCYRIEMTIKLSHWTADKPDTLLTHNEDEVNHFNFQSHSFQ